ATEKMDRLLNDLLNYSKAGSVKIKKTSVNLNSIIQKIRAEFELETRGREINWKTAELPLTEGDPNLIKLALTNLISNALKYTGKLKSATIETGHFVDASNTTVFFVKDNGIGFDMKFKAILFAPFKRFHEHTDFEGSGLGLSNVKRIIELHGGSIWADSVVNSGTTFYFTLPIHKDQTKA
ncbi:MAG: ATP-binding protein, partial [Nitrospinota bacterium]